MWYALFKTVLQEESAVKRTGTHGQKNRRQKQQQEQQQQHKPGRRMGNRTILFEFGETNASPYSRRHKKEKHEGITARCNSSTLYNKRDTIEPRCTKYKGGAFSLFSLFCDADCISLFLSLVEHFVICTELFLCAGKSQLMNCNSTADGSAILCNCGSSVVHAASGVQVESA